MNIKMNSAEKRLMRDTFMQFAITIFFVVCMGVLSKWMGHQPSFWSGFLFGIAAYVITNWIMIGKCARKERIQTIHNFVAGNIYSLTKAAFLVGVMVYFMSTTTPPEYPFIVQIYNVLPVFLVIIGAMATLFLTVNSVMITAIYGCFAFKNSLMFALRFAALSSGALWAIGHYGDFLKSYAASNPEESLLWGLLLSISLIVSVLSYRMTPREHVENVAFRSATAKMASPVNRELSTKDVRHIATHESSHALVYAALGQIPPEMEAVIRYNCVSGKSLGYVSAINSEHVTENRSYAEWYMLVLLAGQTGERFMHGDSTLGSTEDHYRWMGWAEPYLLSHPDEIYYRTPVSKLEQESNELKLKALKKEQQALLDLLFTENRDVLSALSDELMEKRRMGKDDLLPYLSKVKLPDGFPKPFGEFSEFSSDWDDCLGYYLHGVK